ncbi:MAG: hypothetical protein ACPL6C_01120 [bacterium]
MGKRISSSLLLKTFLKFLLWAGIFFLFWVIVGKAIYLPVLGWLISKLPLGVGKLDFLGVRSGELLFRSYRMRADIGIDGSSMMVYFAPYWALIIASPGTIRGRGWQIVYGSIIMAFIHLLAIAIILRMTITGSIFIESIKIFFDAIVLPVAPIILWFIFMDRKALKELLNL